ncbi:hypothetical protein VNO77_19896 [Canavalia gladiata]|uniref:EF-hand domain-containing protein n=1 Tax=Canavalia gladiata TaxID=3824 RepID=A0AAN9LNC6_CANGL
MGALCSCCKDKPRETSLDEKLERKIAEMKRYIIGESKLKSIDSVVMLFPMFKEKLKPLRGMFEKYDLDSNGSIEPNELKRFLEHQQLRLQEQEIDNIFQFCDIDGSKGIQFNEFIALLCLIHLLTTPASSNSLAHLGPTFDRMVEVFLFFDQNGHEEMDRDKNGNVTFREFLFGFINWIGIDADE